MANTHKWSGGSDRRYEFEIYPFDYDPPEDLEGVYIFAKKVDGVWNAVYIGQGKIKDRLEEHREDGCVSDKGSTHVHTREVADKQERLDTEGDLLEGNQEAYAPTGCNEKKGG